MKTTREIIIERALREVEDGMYVNLGIGIPTLIANAIPDDVPKTDCLASAPIHLIMKLMRTRSMPAKKRSRHNPEHLTSTVPNRSR